MSENICNFFSVAEKKIDLTVSNCVFENNLHCDDKPEISPIYRVNLVSDGVAEFVFGGKTYHLKRGDMFYILPSLPYVLKASEDFSFYYISFFGLRANKITDMTGVREKNCVYEHMEEYLPLFEKVINQPLKLASFSTEGILLFLLACTGEKNGISEEKPVNKTEILVTKIKDYIVNNYRNPELSLSSVAGYSSYSPKYISMLFKKEMKVGFSEYLNTVRIQEACSLIENGITSVSDISYFCGYRDPLYFSKKFKAKTGVAPKEFLTLVKSGGNAVRT